MQVRIVGKHWTDVFRGQLVLEKVKALAVARVPSIYLTPGRAEGAGEFQLLLPAGYEGAQVEPILKEA